jgi:hypothetical protein
MRVCFCATVRLAWVTILSFTRMVRGQQATAVRTRSCSKLMAIVDDRCSKLEDAKLQKNPSKILAQGSSKLRSQTIESVEAIDNRWLEK